MLRRIAQDLKPGLVARRRAGQQWRMASALSLFDDSPPPPCPARFNLARHALFAGQPAEKTALIVAGGAEDAHEVWSYGALRDAVARAAGGLRAAGLRRGDRVMLRLGNRADFPILFLAIAAAGGIAAPTSPMLSEAEALHVAADLEARFLCVDPDLALPGSAAETLSADALAALRAAEPIEPVDTAADDPAFAVYTSGSSGKPKGVLHAHRSARARRMMWRGWYGLTAADRMLHAGAFNWTYTLGAGLLDPWGAGASTVIYDGPRDPGIWSRLAAAHGATLFAATPGVLRQLLKYGADLSAGFAGLRHALSAGEKLPERVAEAWRAETGKPVYEALGMSEISTYLSFSPEAPPVPGAVGRPQPGRRVAILAEGSAAPAPLGGIGDLAISRRDPGLMLGYWRAEAETEAAFRGEWFVTGDRAAMDETGAVFHHGRADSVLNAGGYRVAAEEIEAALLAHPAVHEAAAVEARPRPDLTILAAFVVAEGVDAATLDAWLTGRLAAYKRPKRIECVDSLPKTPTGKLMRRALAARLSIA
jgi:acyl-coenzyme A synthetase/AMP-(fatty) acid ligase